MNSPEPSPTTRPGGAPADDQTVEPGPAEPPIGPEPVQPPAGTDGEPDDGYEPV